MRRVLKIFFPALLSFLFASSVHAADFYFSSDVESINVNDEFIIGTKIYSTSTVNAVSGKILFPEDVLELKEILTGGSVINFWVEQPQKVSDGAIAFSGIAPGGFTSDNTLFFLLFKAKKEGLPEFHFDKFEALLNDGFGTPDTSSAESLSVRVLLPAEDTGARTLEVTDKIKPEAFTPQIVRSPNLYNNMYCLVFETADKGVGIAGYEILEQKIYKFLNFEIKTGKWQQAQSPFLLADQKLRSKIYVKAIDKNGNETITMLPPPSPIIWYENYLFWGIIWIAVLIVAIFFVLYEKKYRFKK